MAPEINKTEFLAACETHLKGHAWADGTYWLELHWDPEWEVAQRALCPEINALNEPKFQELTILDAESLYLFTTRLFEEGTPMGEWFGCANLASLGLMEWSEVPSIPKVSGDLT